MIQPRIEILSEKKLVGKRLNMSLANNLTGQLWQSFMPRRREIKHTLGTELISMRVYKQDAVLSDPLNGFDKWAATAVSAFEEIPAGMETITVPPGTYAVFHYKGSSADASIYAYIYGTWLPASGYKLDNRPHFEILGEKYRNNDPDSEEDIYIPVVPK